MTKEIVEALRIVYDIGTAVVIHKPSCVQLGNGLTYIIDGMYLDEGSDENKKYEALKTIRRWLEGQERLYGIKRNAAAK